MKERELDGIIMGFIAPISAGLSLILVYVSSVLALYRCSNPLQADPPLLLLLSSASVLLYHFLADRQEKHPSS